MAATKTANKWIGAGEINPPFPRVAVAAEAHMTAVTTTTATEGAVAALTTAEMTSTTSVAAFLAGAIAATAVAEAGVWAVAETRADTTNSHRTTTVDRIR